MVERQGWEWSPWVLSALVSFAQGSLCSAKAAGEIIAIAARLARLMEPGKVIETPLASMISHLVGKRITVNAKTAIVSVKKSAQLKLKIPHSQR
jgi:hypothetical protein